MHNKWYSEGQGERQRDTIAREEGGGHEDCVKQLRHSRERGEWQKMPVRTATTILFIFWNALKPFRSYQLIQCIWSGQRGAFIRTYSRQQCKQPKNNNNSVNVCIFRDIHDDPNILTAVTYWTSIIMNTILFSLISNQP